MSGEVRSSPHFFRLIKRSTGWFYAGLLIGALLIPAPLMEPAEIGVVPNPVKAAWFLLWIQELVSYSTYLIYPVTGVVFFYLFLPYLSGAVEIEAAEWFPRKQRVVNLVVVGTFLAILGWTVVAMFFRGENWVLTSPF